MVVANKLRVPLGFSLVPLQHAKPSWGLLLVACSAAERGDPVPPKFIVRDPKFDHGHAPRAFQAATVLQKQARGPETALYADRALLAASCGDRAARQAAVAEQRILHESCIAW